MKFAAAMSSPAGRTVRILGGLVVFILGIAAFQIAAVLSFLVMLVGILVLAAGVSNTCYFAPLFGGPLEGNSIER